MRYDLSREIITTSLLKRLWSRIPITTEDACWEWDGGRTPYGHGRISVNDPKRSGWYAEYAHRLVWIATNGADIPAGMVVRHTCDNPPCCNPAHLVLGTQLDNMRDRDSRGRSRFRHATAFVPTPEDIERIEKLYRAGKTIRDIASEYGVTRVAIRRVIPPTKGRSRYRGVSFDSQTDRWRATIQVDGKSYSGGRFADEVEAARAYDALARRLHGARARCNFPE